MRRLLLLFIPIAGAACLHRGIPGMPPVSVSYMVDTASPEHREVLDLWRSYLGSHPEEFTSRPQWSEAEQKRWPIFDLAGSFVYGNASDAAATRGTVFQIAPSRPGDSTEYLIRTVFERADPEWGQRIVIMRVYAMRENGRWVLSNALERETAGWKKTALGSITFVHPPDHTVDTARARMTKRYVDSLATVFDAARPKAITYYLARSPEEVFRIDGIEFYLPGSRAFTIVADHIVFSGVPKYGEFFPHELTHMVLAGVLAGYNTPAVLNEATALWLGGGREMTWPQVKDELARELRRDPSWTLGRLLEERPATQIYRLSAAASLLELAQKRGGLSAVKEMLRSSRDGDRVDVVGGASVAMNMPPSEVEAAWRRSVLGGR